MSGGITAVVRALVDAGATPEMILAAVEAAEGHASSAIDRRRRSDAERQRRRREKKAINNVTSRDVTVTERDTPSLSPFPEPLSTNLSPEPPIVPQIAKAETTKLVDRLWSLANADGRDRSGKHLVRKAVTAALDRGATPEALELDVGRHYRQAETGDRDSKGRTFAKGLHRRIEGDHWMTADPPPPPQPVTPEIHAKRLAHLRDTGEWKPGWGPPPEVGRQPPFRTAA
jgi:hypothetical protein